MLVVSHDLHPLVDRADRVVLLADGRVVADGPSATVATPERLAKACDVPLAAVPCGAAPASPEAESTATEGPGAGRREES